MASPIDSLSKFPVWQLVLGWFGVALLMVGMWYMLYYADAEEERNTVRGQHAASAQELDELETKLENFEEEMEKAAQAQREIDKAMEFLPLSQASLDHLMRTFQQHFRLAGLTIEEWRPGSEKIEQYYAKRPVDITVRGSWNQVGEFFRRVSEMRKIVNIEDVDVTVDKKTVEKFIASSDILLDISFVAHTFRFLSDEERKRSAGKSATRASRRGGH